MFVVVSAWAEYDSVVITTHFGDESHDECVRFVMEKLLPEHDEVEEYEEEWCCNPYGESPVTIVIQKIPCNS